MVTFKNLIDDFSDIATNHYLINSFHSGFLDEVDINKLDQSDFPILYCEPGTATIDMGVLTYSSGGDSGKKFSYVPGEVVLELPISTQPFTARFANILTGWSASMSVQVNNANNLCNAPIEPSDNDRNS